MPFVTRTPAPQPNPRPRIRPVPVVSADPGVPSSAQDPETTPLTPTKKAKPEKRQPTGDYAQGYCRAPFDGRFQNGNPGGPGRPKKDSKSQDELMRAELLKLQQVTEGGRRRRRATRELIPGFLIKATLQKLNTKELRDLEDDARRLFPERPADTGSTVPIDPFVEREYLRELFTAMQLGEPAGDDADPLADFTTSVFEADEDEIDGPLDDEEPGSSDEEPNDEAA